MTDVIAKCITANPISNGSIIVGAPRADDQLGSNYQINTYSSALPTTGIVIGKYDPRFTGLDPCANICDGKQKRNGACVVMWV